MTQTDHVPASFMKEGMPAEFSTEIPAILFEQPYLLACSGNLGVTTDNAPKST